jgi:phospho-N-acetylmuramoyl-pentapeptide-transferase
LLVVVGQYHYGRLFEYHVPAQYRRVGLYFGIHWSIVGFLWYNSYQLGFMGDTGSLAIGGIIAVFAILIRKELLIPILCGVFVAESLSVIIQVSWFKFTRLRFGEGRRIFRMSPLHHHFQKLNYLF